MVKVSWASDHIRYLRSQLQSRFHVAKEIDYSSRREFLNSGSFVLSRLDYSDPDSVAFSEVLRDLLEEALEGDHYPINLDQKKTLYVRDAYAKFPVSSLINIKDLLEVCERNRADAQNMLALCVTRDTEYNRRLGKRFREHFQGDVYFRYVNPVDWVAVTEKSKALPVILRLYEMYKTELVAKFYNTEHTKSDYVARQKNIPFFSMESNTWTPVGHITGYRQAPSST